LRDNAGEMGKLGVAAAQRLRSNPGIGSVRVESAYASLHLVNAF
jgi:hypothetical protein